MLLPIIIAAAILIAVTLADLAVSEIVEKANQMGV